MYWMAWRVAALAALVALSPAVAQQAVTLTITAALVDADGTTLPVPRHALLVSDYPPSAAPQRVVTDNDGSANLNLRPGRYIVESETRVALDGQAYRWIEIVEVAAGGDATLALTTGNARVEPVTDDILATSLDLGGGVLDADTGEPVDVSPSALRRRWRNSVVGLWTPMAHASGFVIDARGIIATSVRSMGSSTDIQVQVTPSLKVSGLVLTSDVDRDVALVRVHPDAVEFVEPLPLACDTPVMPLRDDDDVYTIGAPMRGPTNLVFGTARRVNSRLVVADFNLQRYSAGGPALAGDDGRLVGLTSERNPEADDEEFVFTGDAPIVSIDGVCAALDAVADAMADPPPDGTRLPLDPDGIPTTDELDAAVAARDGDVDPYIVASEDFTVAFLTPAIVYAALRNDDGPTMDFGTWTDYVWDAPPVVLVRVRPGQSESFWSRVMRGAAMAQGTVRSPVTSFKSSFDRLDAFCGEDQVLPLHPFKLDLRVTSTENIRNGTAILESEESMQEGLYVFDPAALRPECGTVTLRIYSVTRPDDADVLEVDPEILRKIRDDLAALGGQTIAIAGQLISVDRRHWPGV